MALVEARGSEQRETATLLLAMADEKGIDRRLIRSVYNGYEVPDELLDLDPEPASEAPKRRGRATATPKDQD